MTRAGVAPPPGRQGPGPLPRELLQALDLRLARRSASPLPGDHMAPGVGTGTELAQLRPYVVGDDVRQLDAAATARTGEPHVRLQVPERALTTWLVLDVSPSMAFGTADRLKADVAGGVALAVGGMAVRRGGRLALLAFGSPKPTVLPPRGGRDALAAVRRAVDEGVAADGRRLERGLADGLARVGRMSRASGLVVVISDFRDEDAWERPLRRLSQRHSVLGVEIRDPREEELPAVGRLVLVDPENGRTIDVDTRNRGLRERFAAAERERRAGLATAFRRANVEHIPLSTSGTWLRDLGRKLR
ncbi:MAG: hypothetical protein QOJ07_953 [Thermoleophilaceae bacterium]|nr:hypothetical protein [Thermoleophilaceae bacterium]